MLAPPGYVARTGIRWTARSKSSRATVAAKGALGAWVTEGHPMAVETDISDTFLWLMVRTAQDWQASQPEPDTMHPDHYSNLLRHKGSTDELIDHGRPARRPRAAAA